jgi:pimeloyl-ACP methyl ester carboxylesterase
VVTAEEDKLTPPKVGEFLEKSIRTASRIHITDAGHLVPVEKPEETNQAILRFLDAVDL